MAILPQSSLFRRQEIEDLRDLERLRLVLGYLPDENLMRHLEADRGRGCDDGTAWEKVTKWFGYRVHLVVDAEYELPVACEVTKASVGEAPQARHLLDRLNERHPAVLEASKEKQQDKVRSLVGAA